MWGANHSFYLRKCVVIALRINRQQRQNEITAQLSSNDSKVIQPELIQTLLLRFLDAYKSAPREHPKRLLQLLIGRITVKHPNGKPRSIDAIELDFDFSEVNVSKTFTLLHLLYREANMEDEFSFPKFAFNDKMPPYYNFFCLYLWYGSP